MEDKEIIARIEELERKTKQIEVIEDGNSRPE